MTENTENTLTAYLGPEFQQRLMWQLLVEPEYAERTIPDLAVEYFDDPNLKRMFIIIVEYFKEFDKVPNLQNQSIRQAINKYKTPNNTIEEETLFSVLHRIEMWNERVINKEMLHDGDVVQKTTNSFIKQQEYRKLGEFIISKTKTGEIKSKYVLAEIEARIDKIAHIGDEEDNGTEVIEGIDRALRKEFRETIPTGIHAIDMLTGGGLGKGEIGVILTPSGVGKTTALTKICNTAYEEEKNVLQIVFEDKTDQIQRKHFAIWAKTPLSEMDENADYVKKIAYKKGDDMRGKCHLVIKEFSQEDTTMMDIRNWIIKYQKKWGFKFDIIVLDYLDCLESHKKTNDRTEAELVIIKSFEAMASDFNIPCWTALQSNRSGFDAELVEAHQSGGSIKRVQKAHFFMSVAKTPAQKESNLANIRIIKARFAADGQTFMDAYFNNDTMEIRIEDERYPIKHTLKKHGDEDIDKLETKLDGLRLKDDSIVDKSTEIKIHGNISNHYEKHEKEILDRLNNDKVNNDKVNGKTEGTTEGTTEGVNPPNDDIGANKAFETPPPEKPEPIPKVDYVSQVDMVDEESSVQHKEPEEKPNTEFHPEVENIHVSGRNDLNHEEKQQLVELVNEVMSEEERPKVEASPPETRSIEELENRLEDPDNERGKHSEVINSLAKLRDTQMNMQKR